MGCRRKGKIRFIYIFEGNLGGGEDRGEYIEICVMFPLNIHRGDWGGYIYKVGEK